jgi:hypothetical protein
MELLDVIYGGIVPAGRFPSRPGLDQAGRLIFVDINTAR